MFTRIRAPLLLSLAVALVVPRAGAQTLRLDQLMDELMKEFSIPGGQLAVVRNGRLVHNRGYGFADVERKRRVRPNSLFRIGSVSKTITQIAVMTLVEKGALSLDDKAFAILESLKPAQGAASDTRLRDITVRHLLKHQGGWDGIEPMFPPWSRTAARTVGTPEPPECETIIRYYPLHDEQTSRLCSWRSHRRLQLWVLCPGSDH